MAVPASTLARCQTAGRKLKQYERDWPHILEHGKALVLLAANTRFGNSDIANLPQSAVDLENGWVEFPRVKTEIPRRIAR